jgi:hypothetical protein
VDTVSILPSIVLKLVTVGVRLTVLFPAAMFVLSALNAFSRPASWIQPVSAVWYLPAFNAVFGILCLMPYWSFLFRPGVKVAFLGIIIVATGVSLRYSLLPFHYESPQLAAYPQYKAEFESAKTRPNGDGFVSERTEGGVTFWHVQKSNYSPLRVVASIGLAFVPLLLFAIRRCEVRRGITWRNFMSPPFSSPSGHAATSSPAL